MISVSKHKDRMQTPNTKKKNTIFIIANKLTHNNDQFVNKYKVDLIKNKEKKSSLT